jgi:hypothetical protein
LSSNGNNNSSGPGGGGGGAEPGVDEEPGEQEPLPPVLPPPAAQNTHEPYITGYPDGTMLPEGSLTRAEAATIFLRVMNFQSGSTSGAAQRFPDVEAWEWYAQAITTLTGNGVLTGYPDGTFHPNDHITRAEFAAILTRVRNMTPAPAACDFPDVPDDQWAKGHIGAVKLSGIMIGDNFGNFRPESNLTRAETVTAINNMLSRNTRTIPADLTNPFSDVHPIDWFYAEILEATVRHNFTLDDEGFELWSGY